MELSKQIIFQVLLVVTLLHCLQGKSIHSRHSLVQPVPESCRDTSLVESLIRTYTENDNATLHRFLNELLPMVNQQYDFKTVDDLLAHLKESNNPLLENYAINPKSIEEVLYNSSNIYAPRRMSYIENVQSSLSSKKKSHDATGSKVSYDDSDNTSEPLVSPMDDINPGDENRDQWIGAKLDFLNKSSREMYQSPKALNLGYDKSHSSVQSSKNVVDNSSQKLLSALLELEEPSMICSPKTIIDILRNSLSPSITNITREYVTDGSSNKFVSDLTTLDEENLTHQPQGVDDSFKNSTRLEVMKMSSENVETDSNNGLPPSSKGNVTIRSIKRTKDKCKRKKPTIISSESENVNNTSPFLSRKPQSSSRNVKHGRNIETTVNMTLNDKSTKITSSETIISLVHAHEVNPPRHLETVESQRHIDDEDSEILPDSKIIPNINNKRFITSPTMKEHLSVIPMDTKNTTQIYLDNFTKDDPPNLPQSSSLTRRGKYVQSKFKDHVKQHELPARNLTSTISMDKTLTNKVSPSSTRVLQGDVVPQKVADNLHDKDDALKHVTKLNSSHFENLSRNEFAVRQAHATVAKYIRNASFPFYQDGKSLEQSPDNDLEPQRGNDYFLSLTENENAFRDTRDENSWESAAFTLPHETNNKEDEPFHISLPQIAEDSSLYKIISSAPKHNEHTHSLGYLSEEYPEGSWHDSAEDILCDGQPVDLFDDDWTSPFIHEGTYFEDVAAGSMPHEEDIGTHISDIALGLHDNNDDDVGGLNISRRHTNANYVYPQNTQLTWPRPCLPYLLPWSYYWQYYQYCWPFKNYGSQVNYNVPPFYCPPCPRSCSDPPPQPRHHLCQPCPQLFCSPQFPPQYPKPTPFNKPPTYPKPPPCNTPSDYQKPPPFNKPPAYQKPPSFNKPPAYQKPPPFNKPPAYQKPPPFNKPPTYPFPSPFNQPPTYPIPPPFNQPLAYQKPPPLNEPSTYPFPPPFNKPPPRPRCPPCPKSCHEPFYSRPSGCKKCPRLNCPLVCPPCPKCCVGPGYPRRPKGCPPCPNVPNCRNCPHCGNHVGIPVTYVCPFCNDHISMSDSPKHIDYSKSSNKKTEYNENTFQTNIFNSNSSPSSHFKALIEDNTYTGDCSILCPACPDKFIYPNYPPRPSDCSACPTKPMAPRANPLPFCRPCPETCVPKNYKQRPYGCGKCPCVPPCPS